MAEMQQTQPQTQQQMQQRTMAEAAQMQSSVAAVGHTWFETAIAQRRFAGTCCQQVAGCCQRVSIEMPVEEMMQHMQQQR